VKVYSARYSTNCEWIALAAGHKGLELGWIHRVRTHPLA
jgi:hypothetical protein